MLAVMNCGAWSQALLYLSFGFLTFKGELVR